jgi:O-antigen/teichoic acid export membrane protein
MSFFRQFLIYGVSGAASRLTAIVLVPLYTRTLSISDYGQLELLLAVHALIVIIAGMQIESAVARDYHAAQAAGEARVVATSALLLTVVGSAIVTLLLLACWMLGWLPPTVGGSSFGLLLALTFPVQLFGVQLAILRFGGRALQFALISFCDLVLCGLFSAWFIVGMKAGFAGALWGILVGKTVCIAIAWPQTFGAIARILPERPVMQRMLAYGIPALPAVLISWLQNQGSRLLLALALTLQDVAIASIAIKVAAVYGFVVYSFRLAWEPFSMAQLATVRDDPRIYARALEWYVATMFMAAGIGVLLCPYLVRVLAPAQYAAGGTVAILFVLGQFWSGVTNVLVVGIHGARRTFLLLPVFGWGALLNAVLLIVLAPTLGVLSAGIGFLTGSIASALLARHFSNKYFNTGFSLKLIGATCAVTIVFALAWYQVATGVSATSIGSGIAAFAGGTALVAALLALLLAWALEPGRVRAMWYEVRGTLHRREARP